MGADSFGGAGPEGVLLDFLTVLVKATARSFGERKGGGQVTGGGKEEWGVLGEYKGALPGTAPTGWGAGDWQTYQ